MAISLKKYNRALGKLFRKPSILGIIVLFCSITKDIINHEFHERIFESSIIRVVDGDTIILDNVRIRLQGIDAPELKQTCYNKQDGKIWQCGLESRDHLRQLISDKKIACTNEGLDRYKRQLSYCYADTINLNRAMVRDGYAVSYTKFDALFFIDEMIAKSKNIGIWSSDMQHPEEFRKSKKF